MQLKGGKRQEKVFKSFLEPLKKMAAKKKAKPAKKPAKKKTTKKKKK
ncbi:MAG: hypothetical protein PVJ67_01170 [Candidatus Pacearchaeota archaeon]|jgi:hypothetical protein